MGISRACASKWVNRWRCHGEAGLRDRPSIPHRQPTATPAEVVTLIESWRRERTWSARRIAVELEHRGTTVSVRTVSRILERLGVNRRRFLDPAGQSNWAPGRIHARWPGHMVHDDVKKVGRIPDGGRWRAHGRGSAQALAGDRAKNAGAKRGYVYLHSAVDGFSRLAHTEHLPDEKGTTAAAFWQRARRFFALHGNDRINREVTDNGTCYCSHEFTRRLGASRHQRTTPYTPRHNGKVERYNRILAEELLYTRPFDSEDARRDAIAVWNSHDNYHRPHTTLGNQPPATKVRHHVINVMASYN